MPFEQGRYFHGEKALPSLGGTIKNGSHSSLGLPPPPRHSTGMVSKKTGTSDYDLKWLIVDFSKEVNTAAWGNCSLLTSVVIILLIQHIVVTTADGTIG